jgi:L-fuconolactonase
MTRNAPSFVDTHVHLWDTKRFHYPWLADLPALNRSFPPPDFSDATLPDAPAKFIFIECGCRPDQCEAEVEWISNLAAKEPRLKGVVAHAPLERGKEARNTLESLARNPLVKGIRRNLQSESDDFLTQSEFIEGINLLVEFGFTFDLCVRASQLPAVTAFVRHAPKVTFVLDHFGKPDVRGGGFKEWSRALSSLADCQNVMCKISGLATEANWTDWRNAELQPFFAYAFACFGPDRVMFGSDWPVATLATSYTRWVQTVLELAPYSNERELTQLFRTNAERIYRV